MDRGAWWAAGHGVTRVRHDLVTQTAAATGGADCADPTRCRPLPSHTEMTVGGSGGGRVSCGQADRHSYELAIICGNSFKAAEVIKIYLVLTSLDLLHPHKQRWQRDDAWLISLTPYLYIREEVLIPKSTEGWGEEPYKRVSSPRPCTKKKKSRQVFSSIYFKPWLGWLVCSFSLSQFHDGG